MMDPEALVRSLSGMTLPSFSVYARSATPSAP